MPNSECTQCCDCLEHFCAICDEHELCADCKEPMCELCREIADEERRGCCYSCHDPDCSSVQFPNQRRIGLPRSKNPREGRLRE
jgi:hypothetical protein